MVNKESPEKRKRSSHLSHAVHKGIITKIIIAAIIIIIIIRLELGPY